MTDTTISPRGADSATLIKSVRAYRGRARTPLRYPGGKNRLLGFLTRLIEAGEWTQFTYAEPYAGGAGAAVALLLDGVVDNIAINDLDPAIYSFWRAVTELPDEFLRLIQDSPIDMEEWRRQREIYRAKDVDDVLALGFSAFFMNRTNRSGVLTGGVIGGLAQTGSDLIDARFNRRALQDRVKAIGEVAGSIGVSNLDGEDFIESLVGTKSFLYADPPYVRKGSTLYMNHFDHEQHASLAARMKQLESLPWLVTYDDVPEVEELYAGCFQGTFELLYSAHKVANGAERLIASSEVSKIIQAFERPITVPSDS